MPDVKTRIAPSPTGDPHVGTAYIALFNRCFAHQHGGSFLLRIEDTDQQRSTGKSEQDILNALSWLGLSWDEGPDVGGDSGPYRQSQRTAIYREHIQHLLDKELAFPCFCSSDRLTELRREQMVAKQTPGYDGHCLQLEPGERKRRMDSGEAHVIRMVVPREGDCRFDDMLRGEVSINWAQVDMQVLIKSDGLPTYHFANVVDDHLMGVTHVIRGEEWINSVPKHALLYEYFDWESPTFCHMPLLRNPDKSKLSKRKNPTSINYYQDMGYLPEALVNYLGMMGWSMPGGEEKFSLAEMEAAFDISRVSLGGPIFDIEKLDWLNGRYLREDLNDADFASRFVVWASKDDRLHKIIPLIKPRVERFSDVVGLASQFIDGLVPLTPAQFEHKALSQDQCLRILQFSLWRLESLSEWDRDAIETAMQTLAAQLDLKIRDFLFPLFVAISGKAVSTSIMDSLAILGLDVARARLRNALSVLGGVSKKLAKNLDKEYRVLGQAEQPD
ncbi:MAG: glutamate--tRNA ligase [Gammaproteobacteria bacterium TMED260]|nr:glutamate--tRNA ligase [Gammaproteobacteria bacterium]OUX34205.1 MAG: glutamate--tRNA ligase [Gammaproteobacteria bacterium TMED260]